MNFQNILPHILGRETNRKQFSIHRLNAIAERIAANGTELEKVDIVSGTRSTYIIAFNDDCSLMASTHGDHLIRITETATMKELKKLSGHKRTPWCVAFHPQKRFLLASGCLDGEVRIWDIQSGGSEVWSCESRTAIASLAFHPFDPLLVIASGNQLLFWDWKEEKPLTSQLTSNGRTVRWVKFDPVGRWLYTAVGLSDHLHTHYPMGESTPPNMQRRIQYLHRLRLRRMQQNPSSSTPPTAPESWPFSRPCPFARLTIDRAHERPAFPPAIDGTETSTSAQAQFLSTRETEITGSSTPAAQDESDDALMTALSNIGRLDDNRPTPPLAYQHRPPSIPDRTFAPPSTFWPATPAITVTGPNEPTGSVYRRYMDVPRSESQAEAEMSYRAAARTYEEDRTRFHEAVLRSSREQWRQHGEQVASLATDRSDHYASEQRGQDREGEFRIAISRRRHRAAEQESRTLAQASVRALEQRLFESRNRMRAARISANRARTRWAHSLYGEDEDEDPPMFNRPINPSSSFDNAAAPQRTGAESEGVVMEMQLFPGDDDRAATTTHSPAAEAWEESRNNESRSRLRDAIDSSPMSGPQDQDEPRLSRLLPPDTSGTIGGASSPFLWAEDEPGDHSVVIPRRSPYVQAWLEARLARDNVTSYTVYGDTTAGEPSFSTYTRRHRRSGMHRPRTYASAEPGGVPSPPRNAFCTTDWFDRDMNRGRYVVQRWDVSGGVLPDLADADKNVVIRNVRAHSDSFFDISSDGRLLAGLQMTGGSETVVIICSLENGSLGDVLYTQSFGSSIVSVSISPCCGYLLVGQGVKRSRMIGNGPTVVAQIYKLGPLKESKRSMELESEIYHQSGFQTPVVPMIGVNSAKWIPRPGDGLVYGTNRGDLRLCRPTLSGADHNDFDAFGQRSMSTQTDRETGARGIAIGLHPRHVLSPGLFFL